VLSHPSHPGSHPAPFTVTGRLKDPFSGFNLLDPVIHLRSLKGISTIMFVQCVNDFRAFHAFLHEEFDKVSLFHFHEK
jgi:hypothetical protein